MLEDAMKFDYQDPEIQENHHFTMALVEEAKSIYRSSPDVRVRCLVKGILFYIPKINPAFRIDDKYKLLSIHMNGAVVWKNDVWAEKVRIEPEESVSLRDHFAGLAMTQILPLYERKFGGYQTDKSLHWESNDGNPDAIAELSYQMADAMLKVRKSKSNHGE